MLMLILGLACGILLAVLWFKKMFGVAQYIFLILGLALLLFTIQNFLGFGRELEPAAQRFVILAMGLPGILLVLLAVFWNKLKSLFKRDKAQSAA